MMKEGNIKQKIRQAPDDNKDKSGEGRVKSANSLRIDRKDIPNKQMEVKIQYNGSESNPQGWTTQLPSYASLPNVQHEYYT